MKYLKIFEKQGNYSQIANNTNNLQFTAKGNSIGNKPKLDGELVDSTEDIIIPSDIEITGHIGSPVKSVRVRKNHKEPKVMKYLKEFKIFEQFKELILYHGGLSGGEEDMNFKKFDKFHNKTSFFADNPRFAEDYANTKSMDMGLDADVILYTCKFRGNLFDYRNKEDMDKLISLIPETVKVNHGTMWFMDHDFSKEEMIKALQGIDIVEPIDYIANANIGDKVPDPSYKQDKMIVVNKDENYVYTIMERTYNDYLSSSIKGYNKHWTNLTSYKEIFANYRNAIIDLYNEKMGTNYPHGKDFEEFYHTFIYALKGYNINYVQAYSKLEFKLSKEDIEKIENIYKECVINFDRVVFKELSKQKWNIKTEETVNNDFWNFYETKTITGIIRDDLKYDGYTALEKGHRTYGIFDPQKTIEIIKVE